MTASAYLGIPELTMGAGFDLAAELFRHGLHAVADAEYRYAQGKDEVRRTWCVGEGDGFRPSRKDDAARGELADIGFVAIPGVDFAVDADFPDTAGDELRVLGAEVQDEDFLGMDVLHGVFR